MIDNLRLVCFDLNKTLIKENIWLDLNLAMGVTKEEDDEFMRLYEEEKITYEELQVMLEDIYKTRGKGNKEKMIEAISKYNYVEGALETINYLKSVGYKIALVTGSIDLLVEIIAKELKVDMFAAHNRLEFDDQSNFLKIICNGDDKDFKLAQLEVFCKQQNISIEQSVCVGDGDNDLKMFIASKHGITFRGSKIESAASNIIDSLSDLRKIL